MPLLLFILCWDPGRLSTQTLQIVFQSRFGRRPGVSWDGPLDSEIQRPGYFRTHLGDVWTVKVVPKNSARKA